MTCVYRWPIVKTGIFGTGTVPYNAMDSFFAAADNLDNLLDELEENEGEHATEDNTGGHVSDTKRPINGLVQYIEAPKESGQAQKSYTSTGTGTGTENAATVSTTNVAEPMTQVNETEENGKENFEEQELLSSFIDAASKPEQSPENCSKRTENGVSENQLSPTQTQQPDPVVYSEINDIVTPSAIPTESQSNSDILIDIFGATPVVPVPSIQGDETIDPEQILSPLNPFSSSYISHMGNDNSPVPTNPPTGLFMGLDDNPQLNSISQGNMSETNPFYATDMNSALEKSTSNNLSQMTDSPPDPDISESQEELKQVNDFLPGDERESDGNSVRFTNIQHPNLSSQQQHQETTENHSSPEPILLQSTPVVANEDFLTSTASYGEESQSVVSSVTVMDSVDPASSLVEEKQEVLSYGFMKDVAVTDEEFERFMAQMEEEERMAGESASENHPEDSTLNNNLSIVTPSIQPSRISPSPNDLNISNAVPASSVLPQDPNISTGSPVPEMHQNSMLPESEVGQFLGTEPEGATLPNGGVHPDTLVHPNSAPEPATIPVSISPNSAHRDGSPTFPLHATSNSNVPSSTQTSNNPQNENRLSLTITRSESIGSEPRYPETPPPPYSEAMHENYERILSPHPQDFTANQQAAEQNQQDLNEVTPEQSPTDDDFTQLPNAVLELIERPGETKPNWVPDQDAPQCSNCANKFTFTKRRHHCRACGRVFCAACCSEKSQLKYMDYKEARVCLMCSLAIKQADALAAQLQQRYMQQAQNLSRPPVNQTPSQPVEEVTPTPPVAPMDETPDVPMERPTTLETVVTSEPTQQQEGQEGATSVAEDMEVEGAMARVPSTKSVRFSDGTRPTHPDEMPSTPPPPSRVNRVRKRVLKDLNGVETPDLPPVVIAHGENGAYAVQESPDPNVILSLLESGDQNPQSFVLNANLIVHVKFVSHANRQCWCYWSEGMDTVGQREVVLLFEREGLGDRQISHDAFTFFTHVFDRARKGKVFKTSDFMPRTMLGVEDGENLFGLDNNAGFLFVRSTSQALDGLSCLKKKIMQFADGYRNSDGNNILPVKSMLFALLVQKNEAPWATLFPMRLMLRLGMEMKQYPCPLFSVRRREPVFHELGHTILAILCDFRNFKYRVMSVPGLRVLIMANGSVSVQIPSNRFTDTMRIINSSNESVLAIGTGTYGPIMSANEDTSITPSDCPCDSHLVCVQDASSNYHTEILTMKNVGEMNTGAAFVIFNGSLKSDGNYAAKCAIVEDGIMIQILREKMEELRASLKSMEDFKVNLAPSAQVLSEDSNGSGDDPPFLEVKWVEDDTAVNIGVHSPIDNSSLEGVVGFNVQGRSEQRGRKHILRWNQVFFLQSMSDPLDMSRLAEQVANGCFLALTPVLHELVKHRQHKIAVRVTIHPENVGYVAGSGCRDLPPACMNALDEHLIQTIHNAASSVAVEQEAVIIELLFSILLMRPAYRTA